MFRAFTSTAATSLTSIFSQAPSVTMPTFDGDSGVGPQFAHDDVASAAKASLGVLAMDIPEEEMKMTIPAFEVTSTEVSVHATAGDLPVADIVDHFAWQQA